MKPTEEKIHSSPSDLPVYLFKQGNNCEAAERSADRVG